MTVWHIEAQAAALSCTQQLHYVPQAGQMNLVGMASLNTLRQSLESKLAEMLRKALSCTKAQHHWSCVAHI